MLQDQAWETLSLLAKMIRQPNVDQIMSRIRAQNGSLTADDRDSLFEKLTWSTWNLVQGPQMDIRFDDPKSKPENFTRDAMDNFSAPSGAAYLAHTEALGQAMIAFNDQIKKENLKKVADAAQLKRRQNAAIEEPGKIPRTTSPVREVKRFFPILVKPAENAIHAHAQLRGALGKYVEELGKVCKPVAYREECGSLREAAMASVAQCREGPQSSAPSAAKNITNPKKPLLRAAIAKSRRQCVSAAVRRVNSSNEYLTK